MRPTGSVLCDRIALKVQRAGWKAITKDGDTAKAIAARAGIGEQTAERFIWGYTDNPRFQTVVKLAEVFGINADAMLGEEPQRTRA